MVLRRAIYLVKSKVADASKTNKSWKKALPPGKHKLSMETEEET